MLDPARHWVFLVDAEDQDASRWFFIWKTCSSTKKSDLNIAI